jgi:hypothetical protein
MAAASTSSLPRINSIRPQTITRAVTAMDLWICSFVRSLALLIAQAEAVSNEFRDDLNVVAFLYGIYWDASTLSSTACAVLKLALGVTNLHEKPADITVKDDNWSVSIVLELFPLII